EAIVELILNSFPAALEDIPFASSPFKDLSIVAFWAFVVMGPASTAASASDFALIGSTNDMRRAIRRRKVFAKLIHLATSPPKIRSWFPNTFVLSVAFKLVTAESNTLNK